MLFRSFVELAELAKANPRKFFDEIDKVRAGKRRRAWVVEELDGRLRREKSKEKPTLLEGEALIRGTVAVGAGRVKEGEAA